MTLHVLATPLGNLDDLSPRAREVLANAALVACEDTRRTAKLLARYGIEVPLLAVHKFSERERLAPVLEVLRRGDDVALVSDGGTPGIADPGALLVAAALDEGIRVSPVPGPSAVIALLSASGLPSDRFTFEGFLPARGGERRRRLRELAPLTHTWVFYEAPHRIRETLSDAAEVLGNRTLVLGRELTKIHETLVRGSADEILRSLDEDVKGEIAVAVAAFDGTAVVEGDGLEEAWTKAVAASGGDQRAALKDAARATGLKKAELWRRLLERRLVRG
ncbi:MAG TPA: 16S rRNA (cytidine(1402)-2'-O)-methyltransferase [Candidatus Polarisedimenticolaceae bacterium]|nr:16S rRNA (cytidine(1402)-2'-O)-methyltransferase [Candidatus Polarisedimenticolaceae bacterium]